MIAGCSLSSRDNTFDVVAFNSSNCFCEIGLLDSTTTFSLHTFDASARRVKSSWSVIFFLMSIDVLLTR